MTRLTIYLTNWRDATLKPVDIMVETENKSVALYVRGFEYDVITEDKNYINSVTFRDMNNVLAYIVDKIDKTKEDIFKVFREELLSTYFNKICVIDEEIASIFKTTKYYGQKKL